MEGNKAIKYSFFRPMLSGDDLWASLTMMKKISTLLKNAWKKCWRNRKKSLPRNKSFFLNLLQFQPFQQYHCQIIYSLPGPTDQAAMSIIPLISVSSL